MIHAIWKDHGDIEGALVSVKHIMISEMSALSPDIKANILKYIRVEAFTKAYSWKISNASHSTQIC